MGKKQKVSEKAQGHSTGFYVRSIGTGLVMLWVYAAVSKLLEYEVFLSQLRMQPFPSWAPGVLVWGLPLLELMTAGLLMFRKSRGIGLFLSFVLLLAFTGYVALVLGGAWEHVPCACGGILNSMGWADHLMFNLFFTGLTGVGLWLWKQKGGADTGRVGVSGEATYQSGGR